jgi:hypothetical protein
VAEALQALTLLLAPVVEQAQQVNLVHQQLVALADSVQTVEVEAGAEPELELQQDY